MQGTLVGTLRRRVHTARWFVFSLLIWIAACGADAKTSDRHATDDTVVTNDGSCSPDNLTATCTCPDLDNIAGRQTCLSGAWSACECIGASAGASAAADGGVQIGDASAAGGPAPAVIDDPPGNSSDNRFAWHKTAFELGSCKAGHYIGTFSGMYSSPVIFNIPVMVSDAPGADGAPGLEFWLTKTPGSGEVFSVDGGKLRGTANGKFPFGGDLTGTLDCATRKYVGRIENGEYDVAGLKYPFSGDVTADYDKIQNAFIAGKWVLVEPGNAFSGGTLDWTATWTSKP